jgi:hypothetical protein
MIASPFVGREVGELLASRIALRRAADGQELDLRVLTAFRMVAIERGFLSASALCALSDSGAAVASIPNLHAKLVMVDEWALVGSGNLSQAGLNSLNVELGLSATGTDAEPVAELFNGWWRHAKDNRGIVARADLRAQRRPRRRVSVLPCKLTI